jgi:hypothetical protein
MREIMVKQLSTLVLFGVYSGYHLDRLAKTTQNSTVIKSYVKRYYKSGITDVGIAVCGVNLILAYISPSVLSDASNSARSLLLT